MRKHSTKATKAEATKKKARIAAEIDAKQEAFGNGLHEFASKAYADALDFFSKHYNDGAALNDLQVRNPGDIHPDWVALSEAVAVIATNKATPEALRQPVVDFLSSESGAIWGGLMVRPATIQAILVAASIRQDHEEEANDVAN